MYINNTINMKYNSEIFKLHKNKETYEEFVWRESSVGY